MTLGKLRFSQKCRGEFQKEKKKHKHPDIILSMHLQTEGSKEMDWTWVENAAGIISDWLATRHSQSLDMAKDYTFANH